jgi:hypothetical protein
MSEELWCCHLRGSDDIIACPVWWVARELAHMINEHVRLPYLKDPSDFWPRVWASPEPWPHTAESHASNLVSDVDCAIARQQATTKIEDARAAKAALLAAEKERAEG